MTQISKEYAGALFSIAMEEGCVRKWADELGILQEALTEQPAYLSLLASPEIPAEERVALLQEAFSGSVSPEPLSLAALLCRRGRAGLLPDVIRRYRDMADEAERIKHGRVTSAAPLTEEELRRLTAKLEASLGASVFLSTAVDPALLGGMIVEIDGRVMDGSLRTRLSEIKEVIGG